MEIANQRRGSPRRCGCRGCRSARRRAGSADRPTARARSRRADARRPRARRAGAAAGGRAARASSSSRARSSTFLRGQPRRCSGRPTFSRQVSVGSRLKNWKMKPILSRRTRVSSSSERPASDSPSMRTSPEVGRSSPPTRLRSVDLPEPDGPMIETISPRGIVRLTRVERDDVALAVELLGDLVELDHRGRRAAAGRRWPRRRRTAAHPAIM